MNTVNHLDICEGCDLTVAIEDLVHYRVTASGGPNKKFSGTVLHVGNDYFVLEEDTLGTVMLPIHHLKYVCVPSQQTTSTQGSKGYDTSNAWMPGGVTDELIDLLRTLKGKVVQLGGGGTESTSVYLVDVMDDYLITVGIPCGVLCFPFRHVHLVVPINASITPEFLMWANERLIDVPNESRFVDALNSETGKVIKLGRGGPEDISGVLRYANEDLVEIVASPHETVYIPTHHVKVFSRLLASDWRSPRAAPIT